ncbi:hypothetical protein [Roseateles terrae]|uniref:Alpha/beta hydrolase family protein n=1 Tax=Roseateles terrae TaxID=431060 RepID=A0ABR6GVH2_9BURK|nr:hypothetical protein [Roseateles terrae]MBB3196112.1 putative alpha/beta hydrolase family protein [Roseateles terrae]OWQ85419.1 hypothetical protein CDN98_15955 [Roseateles terrae]
MNTFRTASRQTVATSVKALAFGIVATAALAVGLAQAQSQSHAQRDNAARPIKLETVYITGTRVVAQAEVRTLPTVYITGRRATTLDGTQVAAATPVNATQPL